MPPKIEKPVNSPNVPPIADKILAKLVTLSLVITSIVGVSKKIFTNLILLFHSKSEIDNFNQISTDRYKISKTYLSILIM